MRNLLYIAAILIVGCSKPTMEDAFIAPPITQEQPDENTDNTATNTGSTTTTDNTPQTAVATGTDVTSQITIVNGELGTVTVIDTNNKSLLFNIESTVNWELKVGDNKYDNHTGEIAGITADEDITVTFVDAPLQVEFMFSGARVIQRWDISFGYPNVEREDLDNAFVVAKQLISESTAEEMITNFEGMTVYLYADGQTGGLGSADGIRQDIFINIYRSGTSTNIEGLAGTIVHEVAHLYDGSEHNGDAGNVVGFGDAIWNNPDGYYNRNAAEYFATTTSAYVGAYGGSHRVQDEPYYNDVTVPLLNTEFNN